MRTEADQPTGFYIGKWGVLGWLETAVKGAGILIGILAFFATSSISTLTLAGNSELGALILVGLLTVVVLGIFGVRVMQREIISILFAIASILGHAGLLVALARVVDPIYPALFAIAFIGGEFVKQRFLRASGYTEAGQTSTNMIRASYAVMSLYVLLLVFVLI